MNRIALKTLALCLAALAPVAAQTAPRVVVVGIDAETQRELGDFGGSYRGHHDDLIRRLNRAGVKGIGFDVSFSTNPDYVGETEALARAAAASKAPVVVAVYSEVGPDGTVQVYPNDPQFAQLGVREASISAQAELLVTGGLPAANAELEAARRENRDPQFEVRTGEWAIHQSEGGNPSLVGQLTDATGLATPSELPVEEVLVGVEQNPMTGELVPVTRTAIRPMTGDPSTITTVSYVDVLRGTVDPKLLEGAVVLIGMNDGVQDVIENPNGRVSGVFVHAFALQRTIETVTIARRRARRGTPRVSRTRCGATCSKPKTEGIVGRLE